jgi:hypothetical protein
MTNWLPFIYIVKVLYLRTFEVPIWLHSLGPILSRAERESEIKKPSPKTTCGFFSGLAIATN